MSTDTALAGTSSYKIVCEDKGKGEGEIHSGYCQVNPVLGDYVCASFRIRGASTWPSVYTCSARIQGIGGAVDSLTGSFKLRPGQDWEQKTLWARCTDDSFTNGIRILLTLYDNSYGGDFPDATCYIDCVQMIYFNDLHYSGSWQIGGTPRADEIARGSLVGLGAEFTTSFEWKPDRSRREWHDNVYVASWTDSQEHIDLYYDNVNSEFVATDGTNTATTTQAFSWDHADTVKFAFTNMHGDFRLSVSAPLSGVEHTLTDNSHTMLGPPVAITFGTGSWSTNHSCGLIANVKHFDSALTVSQVDQIFNLVDPTTPYLALVLQRYTVYLSKIRCLPPDPTVMSTW